MSVTTATFGAGRCRFEPARPVANNAGERQRGPAAVGAQRVCSGELTGFPAATGALVQRELGDVVRGVSARGDGTASAPVVVSGLAVARSGWRAACRLDHWRPRREEDCLSFGQAASRVRKRLPRQLARSYPGSGRPLLVGTRSPPVGGRSL